MVQAEAALARLRMESRKEDTRRKIQLGGLVVKARLHEEASAVLLGLLIEAAETLRGPDAEAARRRWQAIGDHAFAEPSTNDDEDL